MHGMFWASWCIYIYSAQSLWIVYVHQEILQGMLLVANARSHGRNSKSLFGSALMTQRVNEARTFCWNGPTHGPSFWPWGHGARSRPTRSHLDAEDMQREGRFRAGWRRPVRAARPGLRRWTVWCRSTPAARSPFGLLESSRRRLPRAPLPHLTRRPRHALGNGGASASLLVLAVVLLAVVPPCRYHPLLQGRPHRRSMSPSVSLLYYLPVDSYADVSSVKPRTMCILDWSWPPDFWNILPAVQASDLDQEPATQGHPLHAHELGSGLVSTAAASPWSPAPQTTSSPDCKQPKINHLLLLDLFF
jgi:hypothetical protein